MYTIYFILYFQIESIRDFIQKPQNFDINLQTNMTHLLSLKSLLLVTSGSANFHISTETIDNNIESNQFKYKNVSNRKGIFQAIGELKKLQEIINEDKPEPPENEFEFFGKNVVKNFTT